MNDQDGRDQRLERDDSDDQELERDDFDALRGYTDQEAYEHDNPPLPDDPMMWER